MAAATAVRSAAQSPSAVAACNALLVEARKLVNVNEHFTCKICNGYFRDATKIKECAHTLKEFYSRLGIKRKRPDTTSSRSTTRSPPAKTRGKGRASSKIKISFEMHPQRSPDIPIFLYMQQLKQSRMHSDPSTRMSQLRKYIALKFEMDDPEDVEILCRDCPVGPEHSLEFVHRTIWRDTSAKMILEYRRKV
ncbi:hypothetical protein ATCC90586_006281 [Pythium insidiosum]|nr:hypothetical protein ATCC90586_006281 [Pythium insidiosum]